MSTPSTPYPAPAFFGKSLPVHRIRAGIALPRIHEMRYGTIFFGPRRGEAPKHRFDAPGGEFGVCYAGLKLEGCFVETVLHDSYAEIIGRADVEARVIGFMRVTRDLRLVHLYGRGLRRMNVDASAATGTTFPLLDDEELLLKLCERYGVELDLT